MPKAKKPTLIQTLVELARAKRVPNESVAHEILTTYELLKNLKRKEIRTKYFSRVNLGSDDDTFFKACQGVSQSWQVCSGKIFVAAVVSSLEARGHTCELEVKDENRSKSRIDLRVDGKYYLELKTTTRERLGQVVAAYKFKVSQVWLLTVGSDLSAAWVARLAKQGIGCITVGPRVVTGAVPMDGWLGQVTDRWGVGDLNRRGDGVLKV
jgi:hypothetical protein